MWVSAGCQQFSVFWAVLSLIYLKWNPRKYAYLIVFPSKAVFCRCRIQVFHCLKHEGTGGRTLLVDGFYAAEKVRQQSPENFDLLARVPIRHEYIEKSDTHRNHMTGIGPVLDLYPWNKELYLIRYVCTRLLEWHLISFTVRENILHFALFVHRYNNYDRSVINTIPHELVQRWYVAHRMLTTELRRPENELWVKLNPGKVRQL